MTPEKTIEAFKIIGEIIRKNTLYKLMASRFNETETAKNVKDLDHRIIHEHLLFMSEEGQKLVTAGRTEKAMRWLGFLQGALWGLGITSIEEQKIINKPDDVTYDGKRV